MKNWRPDKWETTSWNFVKGSPEARAYYEAGADAMLEKLRPYLLMSLGEMMRFDTLVEELGDTKHHTKHLSEIRELIDYLNEITRR